MLKQSVIILVGMTALGCEAVEEGQDARGLARTPTREAQEEASALLPDVTIEKRFLRSFSADDQAEPELPTGKERGSEWEELFSRTVKPGPAPPGKVSIIRTDHVAQIDEELLIDEAELAELGRAAAAIGFNEASSGEAPTRLVTNPNVQGWAGGVDNRVWKPLLSPSYPYNHRELSRMGKLSNDCTATLLGRRTVLTAAHCVVGAGGPTQKDYTPRRNGSGSGLANAPYGTATHLYTYFPSQFLSLGCPGYGSGLAPACRPYDWAVMALEASPWTTSNGTPGWMGYWIPGTYIKYNSVLRIDGYPRCGQDSNDPAFCIPQTAYGMTTGCSAGTFSVNDTNGQPQVFNFGCDVSAGQSGGAIWSDYPGSYGPYLLGVLVTEDCATCPAGNVYPNNARAMTSELASLISLVKSAFP